MEPLVLFCKTHGHDLLRARRLVKSIYRFNLDQIPIFLSVPKCDLDRFRTCFAGVPCSFITDEEILAATCAVYGDPPSTFPPHLYQQLIKLEFHRMNICRNYVWLDSDSFFIRPFSSGDFLHHSGVPYLVLHDCSDLLDFARRTGKKKIIIDYYNTRKNMKRLFGRIGPDYDFGPSPVAWSTEVLVDMHTGYLIPKQESIFSLLTSYPCELLLYGEFVFQRKKIPVYPVQPFFKVYHYAEQFFEDEMNGVSRDDLRAEYLGLVIQSNWTRLPGRKRSRWQRVREKIQTLSLCFT